MTEYKLQLLEEYSVQKKWKKWSKPHGVYCLSFRLSAMRNFRTNEFTLYDGRGNNPIELTRSIGDIMTAASVGNVRFTQSCVTMIGEFVKIGSQVIFKPLVEPYEN